MHGGAGPEEQDLCALNASGSRDAAAHQPLVSLKVHSAVYKQERRNWIRWWMASVRAERGRNARNLSAADDVVSLLNESVLARVRACSRHQLIYNLVQRFVNLWPSGIKRSVEVSGLGGLWLWSGFLRGVFSGSKVHFQVKPHASVPEKSEIFPKK